MTFDPRLERTLPAVLADLGAGPTPEYTDDLLERISRVRQRPAWVFPERWLPAAATTRRAPLAAMPSRITVVVALLLLALVVAGILAGVGHSRRLPAPFGPAANGAIVYDAGGDIYTGDPTTGASHAIVPGPTDDFRPGYSPDGGSVAFLRRVDPGHAGATDVVVMPAGGGQPRIITIAPLASEPAWWSWTPDSQSIVVMMSNRPNPTYDVFDASRASPPTVITPAVAIDPPMVFQPPTGGRVLFRGRVGSEVGLYTMDLDGNNLVTLVQPYLSLNDQIDLVYPAWSPDGTRIVFQQVATDGSSTYVFVMNADGSQVRRIADPSTGSAGAGWASWSPDGTRILFQSANGSQDSTGYYLYSWAIVRVADGTIVKTGPVLAVDTLAQWSPDGREIMVLNATLGHSQLILDPDGGTPRTDPWSAVGGDWQRMAP